MTRTPIDILFDRADRRCTKCNARAGTCGCWVDCRCGWMKPADGTCGNPVHAVEDAAKEMAALVTRDVLHQMRSVYPEPMKHASGGFQRTLKARMNREFANALTHWMMAAKEPVPGPTNN